MSAIPMVSGKRQRVSMMESLMAYILVGALLLLPFDSNHARAVLWGRVRSTCFASRPSPTDISFIPPVSVQVAITTGRSLQGR